MHLDEEAIIKRKRNVNKCSIKNDLNEELFFY